MTRLLREAGEALYGTQWQSEMARDLNINTRTVQRWVAGVGEPAPGHYLDILRITQERAMMLDALADRLKREAAPGDSSPD